MTDGDSLEVWGRALEELDLMHRHVACVLGACGRNEPQLRARLESLARQRGVFGRELGKLRSGERAFGPQHEGLLLITRHETGQLRSELLRLGQVVSGCRPGEERN